MSRRNIKSIRQSLIFIILTFICSHLCWDTLIFSPAEIVVTDGNIENILYALGGFSPTIFGIILTIYFDGKKGFSNMIKKLSLSEIELKYYGFVMLFTLASVLIPHLICVCIGIPSSFMLKERFTGDNIVLPDLAYLTGVIILGGGFNEEVGWRGFLVPRIQRMFNPIITSIIIGSIWALWHYPLFLLNPNSYIIANQNFETSLVIYYIETIWLSFILTWLMNKSKGCVTLVILMHGVDNTILSMIDIENTVISFYIILVCSIRVILFLFILIDMIKNPKNKITYF